MGVRAWFWMYVKFAIMWVDQKFMIYILIKAMLSANAIHD
jgi:hypothetical protein